MHLTVHASNFTSTTSYHVATGPPGVQERDISRPCADRRCRTMEDIRLFDQKLSRQALYRHEGPTERRQSEIGPGEDSWNGRHMWWKVSLSSDFILKHR